VKKPGLLPSDKSIPQHVGVRVKTGPEVPGMQYAFFFEEIF
jgi:hypothetical protein